jgi:DNA-binding MarR family transcriptional regulator
VTPPKAERGDHAARVWADLQAFVYAQDRRDELRETLGLGRGTGRIAALLNLTQGPLTLRHLAEIIGVDAPYATLIVDQLQARGLVERTLHPGDRRCKLVTLTPAGREAAALAARIKNQPPAGFAQLTDADLAALENVLKRLSPGRLLFPDPAPREPLGGIVGRGRPGGPEFRCLD